MTERKRLIIRIDRSIVCAFFYGDVERYDTYGPESYLECRMLSRKSLVSLTSIELLFDVH